MRPRFWQFAVPALLAAAVWVAIDRHARTGRELRDELAHQHARADEQAQLQAENQRLVAAQPTAEQLAALRARQEALEQLRAQLAALRRREAESARAAVGEAKPVAGLLNGASASYLLWQDVGQATPEAAFETTLWAAVHGNIDSLGFTFEGWDAMGLARTMDANQPVDTATVVKANTDFDGSYADGNALAAALAQSADVRACVARQLFRASAGRSDGSVAASEEAFLSVWSAQPATLQGNLAETIVAYVKSSGFVQRRAQ